MSSLALRKWEMNAAASLDEVEAARTAIGGTDRGRRYATQQINCAYAVLLSSQVQAYCRDLHSESVDILVPTLGFHIQPLVRRLLTQSRKLDHGNPNPGNLGADFGRFEFQFWPEVRAQDRRAPQREAPLKELNTWRNAIAHQDFDPSRLGGTTTLRLVSVRQWRSSCDGLARTFDKVMNKRLLVLTGSRPW